MNKLSCHFERLTTNIIDWIQLAQPPIVVWVDPNQDGVDAIKQRSPDTFVVGRRYEAGQNWQINVARQALRRASLYLTGRLVPVARRAGQARYQRLFAQTVGWLRAEMLLKRSWDIYQAAVSPESWADQCVGMAKCDAYITWNEAFGHDHSHLFQPFDQWQCKFRERLLIHGIEAVAFNFGTGNFTAAEGRVKVSEAFPLTCAQFRYFGIHEYHWPDMQSGLMWHTVRFPTWHNDIGRDNIELIVTECGMTQHVLPNRGDVGWRTYDDGVTDESYLATLAWYNEQLCKYPYLKGAAIFNWGGHSWPTFEHEDHPIRFQIAALDAPSIEPEPPTNGGDNMVKIYDFENGPPDGATRDMAWLESIFGAELKVHPITEKYQPEVGDWVCVIDYLDARVGDTSCIINVKDEQGNNVQNATTLFWWQSAEEHGLPDYDWNWTSNGARGSTNENGDVGPGMGKGAYYDPETQEGPHKVWLYDLPSEMVSGIGMLPGGNPGGGEEGPHAHVNIGYKRVRWEGTPTPPPTDGYPAELRNIADRIRDIANLLGNGAGLRSLVLRFDDGTEREVML